MTDETGGRMIVANSEKHLAEAFDHISEELRSQYTLGYYPTNTAHDGKFRKIKVETSNHEYKVLARKGYSAPKSCRLVVVSAFFRFLAYTLRCFFTGLQG